MLGMIFFWGELIHLKKQFESEGSVIRRSKCVCEVVGDFNHIGILLDYTNIHYLAPMFAISVYIVFSPFYPRRS